MRRWSTILFCCNALALTAPFTGCTDGTSTPDAGHSTLPIKPPAEASLVPKLSPELAARMERFVIEQQIRASVMKNGGDLPVQEGRQVVSFEGGKRVIRHTVVRTDSSGNPINVVASQTTYSEDGGSYDSESDRNRDGVFDLWEIERYDSHLTFVIHSRREDRNFDGDVDEEYELARAQDDKFTTTYRSKRADGRWVENVTISQGSPVDYSGLSPRGCGESFPIPLPEELLQAVAGPDGNGGVYFLMGTGDGYCTLGDVLPILDSAVRGFLNAEQVLFSFRREPLYNRLMLRLSEGIYIGCQRDCLGDAGPPVTPHAATKASRVAGHARMTFFTENFEPDFRARVETFAHEYIHVAGDRGGKDHNTNPSIDDTVYACGYYAGCRRQQFPNVALNRECAVCADVPEKEVNDFLFCGSDLYYDYESESCGSELAEACTTVEPPFEDSMPELCGVAFGNRCGARDMPTGLTDYNYYYNGSRGFEHCVTRCPAGSDTRFQCGAGETLLVNGGSDPRHSELWASGDVALNGCKEEPLCESYYE